MTASLYASIGLFSGLDTVTDPTRLEKAAVKTPDGYKTIYPLTEAMNVEIDNSYALSSRAGLVSKLIGTNLHSMWANPSGTLCYFCDGPALYKLHEDYSQTLVTTLSGSGRVSFEEFNDRIYYSNGIDIGYIKSDVRYGIPLQTKTYKEPLPAGKFLCVYLGKLYVAKDNILYVGDPLSDCYDIRSGYRVFDSDILMLLSVETGFYVSDSKNTWFLTQDEGVSLSRELGDTSPAIPYTGIRVTGASIGEDGMAGMAGVWVSKDGICVGNSKGGVVNVTDEKYILSGVYEGAAFIKAVNGTSHYITVLRK